MGEWISTAEAAEILGVHRNTVYASLKDPEIRAERWGVQGIGWRYKPLSTRNIFQVSRERTEQLADPPSADPGTHAPSAASQPEPPVPGSAAER
jgi:excisionase family DNA binding protein